ncbi:hypothetical protein PCH_Pc22g15700 [Penicillium rubens Wisconsin 54-1255]|uniref:Uncharacterized protein n=1 Tax=Penicillium rubens (strain ATCC 28089 / DSM 1075 / NRRL 1951 / Wisconsin 54-1255) TaxID=500485 RepID=B6HQ05_PENRW|nr:hypothetical protein PCH_Pc22g15700 [Penicillium rubens Wisconsin 54-1255]
MTSNACGVSCYSSVSWSYSRRGKKPMIEHLFVDIFADHCPHKFAFAKLSYSSGIRSPHGLRKGVEAFRGCIADIGGLWFVQRALNGGVLSESTALGCMSAA